MIIALVRYGVIPEVARCEVPADLDVSRDDVVILETHRGLESGRVLQMVKPPVEPGVEIPSPSFKILRLQSQRDTSQLNSIRQRAHDVFEEWQQRIAEWNLDLQLVDLEWTLDEQKLILYVLNERGPECTKLALQAAAAGLGIIEVQPVAEDGPVAMPSTGGGCGSCGAH